MVELNKNINIISQNMGLVFASKMESKPFIKGLKLSKIEKKPFDIYNKDRIYLINSGIGKANAAIATSYLIWKYNIPCIFNIGAAGATTIENRLGDIFHINKVIEYDRPRIIKKGIRIIKPDVLKGRKTASLSTQDKAVIQPDDRQEMSKHADLVDMEGASVIQACKLWNVKCYLFKFVTDTPEHKEIEIIKNIDTSAKKMFDYFSSNIMRSMQIDDNGKG